MYTFQRSKQRETGLPGHRFDYD